MDFVVLDDFIFEILVIGISNIPAYCFKMLKFVGAQKQPPQTLTSIC